MTGWQWVAVVLLTLSAVAGLTGYGLNLVGRRGVMPCLIVLIFGDVAGTVLAALTQGT